MGGALKPAQRQPAWKRLYQNVKPINRSELPHTKHEPIWRPGGPVGPMNPDHIRPGWGVPGVLKTPNDWRDAGRALHTGVEEARHGILTHRLEDKLTTDEHGHRMWKKIPAGLGLAARLGARPRISAPCASGIGGEVGDGEAGRIPIRRRGAIELDVWSDVVKHAVEAAHKEAEVEQHAADHPESNQPKRPSRPSGGKSLWSKARMARAIVDPVSQRLSGGGCNPQQVESDHRGPPGKPAAPRPGLPNCQTWTKRR